MKEEKVLEALKKVRLLRERAAAAGKTSLEFLRDFVKARIKEALTESVVLSPESLKDTEREEVLAKLEDISAAVLLMTFELCISSLEAEE